MVKKITFCGSHESFKNSISLQQHQVIVAQRLKGDLAASTGDSDSDSDSDKASISDRDFSDSIVVQGHGRGGACTDRGEGQQVLLNSMSQVL